MVKQLIALCSILFLTSTVVLANEGNNKKIPALELSSPNPAIMTPVSCDDAAQMVTYTVKNNTSSTIHFEAIKIEALANDNSDSELTIASGSCVSSMKVAGKKTCTIDVGITPTACTSTVAFPQQINRELYITSKTNQAALKSKPIDVVVLERTFIAVATGTQGSGADSTPLLAVHNANKNWSTIALPKAIGGIFNSSTCSGNSNRSVCIAAGQTASGAPLLYLSQDGGVTWKQPTLQLPASGVFYGVSCTGDGATALCHVVGRQNNAAVGAIILQTKNGGTSWTLSTPTGISLGADSELYAMNCSDSTHCMGVGSNGLGNAFLIDASLQAEQISAPETYLFDASCHGVVCAAVGYSVYDGISNPLLPYVYDNGTLMVLSIGMGETLYGIDCTGLTNTAATCVLVGMTQNGSDTPNGAISTLQINDEQSSPDFEGVYTAGVGAFYDVSCLDTSDGQLFCGAVGIDDYGTTLPSAAYSHGDLSEWSSNSNLIDPTTGAWVGTACSEIQGKFVCTAAGQDASTPGQSLLYVNEDSTAAPGMYNPWGAVTTSPPLPTVGCFSNAGSNGSSTGSLFYPLASSICDPDLTTPVNP